MKSFLKEIEQKFLELESADYCDSCDKPLDQCICNADEIDEQNVTGAVAGYNTPAAFAKPGKWKNKKIGYASGVNESVNTPPTFRWDTEDYQTPESEEEEYVDKFPFAIDTEWQHKNYKYPSVDLSTKPGTATKKHKALKVGKTNKLQVEDILEKKYEQIIEGYRDFKSGDVKPSVKVKDSIREIAKKLKEIETIVNYSTKYKNEAGVTSAAYGPGTTKALTEISNRLIKMSERIRSLGE